MSNYKLKHVAEITVTCDVSVFICNTYCKINHR